MKKANIHSTASVLRLFLVAVFGLGLAQFASAQCTLVCNDLVQVSMDEDCVVEILPDMILEGIPPSCNQDNLQVIVYKDYAGTQVFAQSPNVTVALLNKTVLVKVKDLSNGNSCWGHIKIEDKLAPACTLTDLQLTCANIANYTPAQIGGIPTVGENCGTFTTSFVDFFTDLGCDAVVGNLAGRNEVPANSSPGEGTVVGTLTGNTLSITITYSGLTAGLTDSHIHSGAAGANGPVIFNLNLPVGQTSGSVTKNVALTAAQVVLLKADGLYVNLHTNNFPGGEIRAQLNWDVSAVNKRVWTFTDASGNFTTCSQFLYFNRIHAAQVIFPPNVTIDCSSPNTDPCGAAGSPTVPGGASIYCGASGCELNVAFTDQLFPICAGTDKILRTWTLYDWCLPTVNGSNPVYYIQVIMVTDSQAPEVQDCPGDLIFSANNANCSASFDLPTIVVEDDCSTIKSGWAVYTNPNTGISTTVNAVITPIPGIGQYNVNFGNLNNVPVGEFNLTFNIQDDCGNVATCVSHITVEDLDPPTAICQEFTQIAIGGGFTDNFCNGPNGPVNDVPGIANVPAAAFNSGSYDNCGPVFLKVRRMNGGQCGGASFDDQTKFCCSDIGGTWTVVLRVYDVDPGPGVVGEDAFDGHYNDCMITAYVEDKVKPVCTAPANQTVQCDAFDPLVWYGNLGYSDNCGVKKIDTAIAYVPNQIAFEQCNYGQVRRTFTVRDCGDNTSRCTQTITVNYRELYRVYFPDDKNITTCGGTSAVEQPIVFGENCELIGISKTDQVFDIVPDACFKILRHWEVINWCTYNPNLGSVGIQNPNTSTQGARVWIGATVANVNPNSPDVPTVLAKNWTYPAPLNGTASNMEGTPSYTYTQVIKVQDATPPQASIDPQLGTANYTFCDYSTNDPQQWNQDSPYNPYGISGTWKPTCQSHDVCEGVVDLSIRAKDDCTGNNINFRYLLFLDLNGDGVMETTINSEAPTLGFGIREDEADGDFRIGRVTRDFESDDPDHTKYAEFALPYGSHKIKWVAEDRCGNDVTKEYPIIVKDCKNPTVVCINGLSVNQMNVPAGGTTVGVTLWAIDFLKYAEDNCTDASQIVFAIRDADINPGTGFPLDAQGQPQSNLTWNCSQIGTNTVELWAKDKWGNVDFCLTYLLLSDNTGACTQPPGTGVIAGFLKNDAAVGVSDAIVELKEMVDNTAFPDLSFFNTDNNGQYGFFGIPMAGDYKLTPTKDINPLNGVSTFDLVRMSKHILNVQPFTTGNQFVAADINKNGQVTTFDIVELRKLILGIYSDFPQNGSWRFISKSHVFDLNAPLAGDLGESMIVPANSAANDFVSIKIGDLTGDAIANNLTTTDDRTTGTLVFNVEDRAVKVGEVFTVDFTAAEKVLGSQFTLVFAGLKVSEVVPGAGLSAENFAIFSNENAVSASLNMAGAASFSVKFVATADGQLSQMLGLSSRITKAEAYSIDEKRMDVALQFRNGLETSISGVGFELYQNTPNPVDGETSISFNLPEASAATLTVTDLQGRVLAEVKKDFNKGTNTVVLNGGGLKATGVVFYQLSAGGQTAVRKMVVVE